MLLEFLCFRYQGIKRPDEILKDRKTKESFGWKCRKYIKWDTVHNDISDRHALYEFANNLIDRGRINFSYYDQVSLVFFNVQKWKLDKDNFAIEPALRKPWEQLEALLQVVQDTPHIMLSSLEEQKIDCKGLNAVDIQVVFYIKKLYEFLCDSSAPDYISGENVTLQRFDQNVINDDIHQKFEKIYKSVGKVSPLGKSPIDSITQIYHDFGFEQMAIKLDLKLSTEKRHKGKVGGKVIFEYVNLGKTRLLHVHSAHDNIHVHLNVSHRYIRRIQNNHESIENFELFIRAYVKSMYAMMGSFETISSFTDYIGVELERIMREEEKHGFDKEIS